MTFGAMTPTAGVVPRDDDFTRPFWRALSSGELITTRCQDCEALQFPPRVVCMHCWSSALRWETLTGHGVLVAFTEIHAGPAAFADELPYTIGLVDLDEGVRVVARISAPFEDLSIGRPVQLLSADRRGVPLITFSPQGAVPPGSERTA